MVNGQQIEATGTKWAAYEATRRSDPLPTSNVVVTTATRMPFEQTGVVWVINFTNPTSSAAVLRVDFALGASIKKYETVGTWVYDVPNDVTSSVYTPFTSANGAKGVYACGPPSHAIGATKGPSVPACAQYQFVGDMQPDSIHAAGPPPSPPAPLGGCLIAGKWVQETSGQVFGPIVENQQDRTFTWTGNPKYPTEGWNTLNGTLDGTGNIVLHYFRTYVPDASPSTLLSVSTLGDVWIVL